MKEIQLTQGKVAIVDDEDYEYLNQWKWHNAKGYAVRVNYVDTKPIYIYMHRDLMKCQEPMQVDHINRNRSDNRKENLRICTGVENSRNSGTQRNNTSGYKGVSWKSDSGKWRARIKVDGKIIHLGEYIDIEEAAIAYDLAAKKHHDKFAVTNFRYLS